MLLLLKLLFMHICMHACITEPSLFINMCVCPFCGMCASVCESVGACACVHDHV